MSIPDSSVLQASLGYLLGSKTGSDVMAFKKYAMSGFLLMT